MKAFILALALVLSVSLGMCEQFTADNAVLRYDADGALQVILWVPTFDDYLTFENGVMQIGGMSQSTQPVQAISLPLTGGGSVLVLNSSDSDLPSIRI